MLVKREGIRFRFRQRYWHEKNAGILVSNRPSYKSRQLRVAHYVHSSEHRAEANASHFVLSTLEEAI